jgi:ADP-heptose:LPS heptosyltransferase
LTTRVVVRSELGDVTTPWVQILLDYARAIGCDSADVIPRFVPTSADRDEAAGVILSGAAEGCAVEGPYIILHPTNAVAPKRGIWPVEGWARLATALAERFDVTVLLSGSKADTEINRRILANAAARSKDRIVDVSGKLGIGAFGALARSAVAFVGITTGTMHVAAAVGAATVGIFPFQSDVPDRWAPLGARTAVVRPSYPCHPGDKKETCADYACIGHLDVERILAATERLVRA